MLIIDDYTVAGTLAPDCDETTFRSQLTTLARPECAKHVATNVQVKKGTFSIKLTVGEPDESLNELDEYMDQVRRLQTVADCDGDFRDHDIITEEEQAQAAAMGAGMQNFNDMMELEEQAAQPVAIASGPKVSRNAPCPCGSGKKYKKCCGAVA